MRSKEELNNTKGGEVNEQGREKTSADFSLKSKNEPTKQTQQPEKNSNENQKIKKKVKSISKILTAFTTVVSVSLIGVAGINVLIPPTITVNGAIEEVYTTPNEIYYFVTLETDEETDDVYVVLYNDFTNRSQKVESAEWQGSFENLRENMTYTIALKQGGVEITSKVVKTVYDRDNPDYNKDDYIDDQSDDPTGEDISDDQTDDDQSDDPTNVNLSDDPTGANTNDKPTGANG